MLQNMAGSTLTQLQPEVSKAFTKLNDRVPEVTQATMKELELLQKNLPERTEKSLNETFGKMLESKDKKIKEMFPEATDDQVHALLSNLAEQGHEQVKLANEELFAAHQQELADIIQYMQSIKKAEAKNIKGVDPTWEMGLLVLDIFRADLEELRPDKTKTVAKEAKK
jgi:Asp-tRNA(Asn)/Glu-tRNA(Gln) amidotransferase C subunit